jgi:hypothetical protein
MFILQLFVNTLLLQKTLFESSRWIVPNLHVDTMVFHLPSKNCFRMSDKEMQLKVL